VPAIRGVGGADRPGIVHRLDRDTSGLLVVAKTARVHRALVEAMRRRGCAACTRARVWGRSRPATSGTIEHAIGRDARERKRMAVVERGGRPASRTGSRQRFGVAARWRCGSETGRTHQIRVHFAHAGHPVIGDPVYGGRPKKQLSNDERQRSWAAACSRCLSRQGGARAEPFAFFASGYGGRFCEFKSPLPGISRRPWAGCAYARGRHD